MVQYELQVLNFPTIHPDVLKLHPDLVYIFNSFRVALKPDKSNNAFISLSPEPKALFPISINPSSQFLMKDKDKYIVRRKDKTDLRVKVYKCFPATNWEGMSWFSYDSLKSMHKRGFESLMAVNLVHPKDAERYMGWRDKGLEYCDRTRKVVNSRRRPRHKYKGATTINLLTALDRMQPNESVRATTSGMSFDMVSRSYLEYLVYDGSGVGVGMKSALNSVPGVNALRDSIILYLNKTNNIQYKIPVKPKGAYVVREGLLYMTQEYGCDPEVTRAVRKQWERIDIPEQKDLEWKPFCTFGYYDKDTFVSSGLPYNLPFQSHGVPTWIKKNQPLSEKSSDHFQSLEEWERNMPWKNEEEVESFRPFEVPNTYQKQIKWFWELKKIVFTFKDRWEHHMSRATVERSEIDRQRYLWDRDELESEHQKMTWESNEILKANKKLKRLAVVKNVLKELKQALDLEAEQLVKDRELAKVIYEWIRYYTCEHKRVLRQDEKLLDFNLKLSKARREKAKRCLEVPVYCLKAPLRGQDFVFKSNRNGASFYYQSKERKLSNAISL